MSRNCSGFFAQASICAFAAWALSVTTFAGGGDGPTSAGTRPRTEFILSHLPLKTSRAYHALRKAAGDAKGEILSMTKSEVWSVPAENAAALRALAIKSGVAIKEVGDTGMDALAHLKPGTVMTPKQHDMMDGAKKDKSTMGVTMMALPEPAVLEYALTRGLNKSGLDAPALTLSLSDAVTVKARRTGITQENDSYIWHGEIEGTGEPVTLVVWPMGRIAGTIQHAGRIYKVQSMGGGLHGVIETAPKMLPPEHAPMGEDMRRKMNMNDDPLFKQGDANELMKMMPARAEPIENLRDIQPLGQETAKEAGLAAGLTTASEAPSWDDPVTITLIVAYTKAAARHYTDIGKDLIALAVAETNQSFKKSSVGNVQVKAVYTYQSPYVEKGTHFEHMYQFAEKGDGVADEIHKLRDTYKADIALMIVDDANGCGLSAGVAPPSDRAFAVVHHGCAATSYSLSHEIGHIIGARHDVGLDENKTPFPFGHGFISGNKKWRTMMSYEQSCDGCPRLPVWSNPDVRIQGEPAGSDLANNARAIREGAGRVSRFR